MRKLRIKEYDVILENIEHGKGKIIIASPYLNTSYYWGAMGSTLEEFICSIDLGYWLNKLTPVNADKPLDTKRTFANFRRQLKENFEDDVYGYGWWVHMEFQSEMREEIRSIQNSCYSQYDFVDSICQLPKRLPFYLIDDGTERKEMEDAIKGACCEPWHYIELGESREEKVLRQLYNELRKELKKPLALPNSTDQMV